HQRTRHKDAEADDHAGRTVTPELMKMHRYLWKIFRAIIMFAHCVTLSFAGRGDKVGTASGIELLIPIGARSIALGSSSLALVSGTEAIYWNPAGLVRENRSTGVMISHMSYLADINIEYA